MQHADKGHTLFSKYLCKLHKKTFFLKKKKKIALSNSISDFDEILLLSCKFQNFMYFHILILHICFLLVVFKKS